MTDVILEGHYADMSDEAKELVLHADNNSHLYHSSHMPIMRNLSRKMKKGKYEPALARKAWEYHADRAAQSYSKEFGSGHQKWHEMFKPAARKAAAAHWESMHRDELKDLHEGSEAPELEAINAGQILEAVENDEMADLGKLFEAAMQDRIIALVAARKDEIASTFFEAYTNNEHYKAGDDEVYEAGSKGHEFTGSSSEHPDHFARKSAEKGYAAGYKRGQKERKAQEA